LVGGDRVVDDVLFGCDGKGFVGFVYADEGSFEELEGNWVLK